MPTPHAFDLLLKAAMGQHRACMHLRANLLIILLVLCRLTMKQHHSAVGFVHPSSSCGVCLLCVSSATSHDLVDLSMSLIESRDRLPFCAFVGFGLPPNNCDHCFATGNHGI